VPALSLPIGYYPAPRPWSASEGDVKGSAWCCETSSLPHVRRSAWVAGPHVQLMMPSDNLPASALSDLDAGDAAAMREPLVAAPGGLRHAISDAFVALFKEHFGKGPTKCRTFLEPDLIVVLLRGGCTPAERTLIEAGRWPEVRDTRRAWQDAMAPRFAEKIEELTGRTVEAFMSTSHADPDVTMEAFTLEPNGKESA
jgi:uncharacterized protein YbcI